MSSSVHAQEEYVQDQAEQAESVRSGRGAGDFVVAPIPIVDPTLGNGLGLIAMRLYKLDEGSQASLTGVGGLYTDTESWGAGIANVSNFGDDAWKVKGGAIYFDLNLEFFGTGNEAGDKGISVPVQQNGWAVGAQALRRIAGEWYGGLRVWHLQLDSTFDLTALPPDLSVDLPPTVELDSEIAGLGVVLQRDSRDNQFNAFKGSLFDLTWSKAADVVGSDFDFQSVHGSYNIYRTLADRKIIAARISACATPGDTPYYALCKFGQNNDLRGYIGGRYRDKSMLAIQAEYRWRFFKRLGLVAFAGVGEVVESFGDLNTDSLLPSGGVGLRFLLSPDNRLNLSVDWAAGKDDDYFFFYVGESF